MKEIFRMWSSTRMVVLVSVVAAVYAAVLIPFKFALPLIPGATEVRPAVAIPVLSSFLFGPAAAWGAAFGNLIGDSFGGTLGPGTIFGFIGNFLYAYLPYRIWKRLAKGKPNPKEVNFWLIFVPIAVLSAGVCGATIGWGLDALKLVPYIVLGNIIVVNNFILSMVLCPLLLAALYGRVEQWGLMYTDLMDEQDISSGGKIWILGLVLLVVGIVGTYLIGNAAYSETFSAYLGMEGPLRNADGVLVPGGATAAAPFAVIMIIGALLI